MTERDRYAVQDGGVEGLAFVSDALKDWPAGDYAEADPPLGGPMPRDLAEAIASVANAAHTHPGGFVDDFFDSTTRAVAALDRIQALAPADPRELFRVKPSELRELSDLANQLVRSLRVAAVCKSTASARIEELLEKAGAES